MWLSLLAIILIIRKVYTAQHFLEPYLYFTTSTPGYTQYSGLYLSNITTRPLLTADLSDCGHFASGVYSGTIFYQLEGSDPAVWLYEDWTLYNSGLDTKLIITEEVPCADIATNPYIMISTKTCSFDSCDDWGTFDATDWKDYTDTETIPVSMCSYPQCNTSFPTVSPSYEPTMEPTVHPTDIPTLEPTTVPTIAPTAPYVKYWAHESWTTITSGHEMAITMFALTDPFSTNYIKFTMTGPNNLTWMQFFRNGYGGPYSDILTFFRRTNHSSGYIVNPTNETSPGGEIFLNSNKIKDNWDYTGYDTKYTQNSTINKFERFYTTDSSLIQFQRSPTTSDGEDFKFNFTNLIEPFYICWAVVNQQYEGITAPTFDGLNDDFGCKEVDFTGNYGIRAKWEMMDPDITIYFEYDPFERVYSGYVIKPINSWVYFGNWYESNETASINSNQWTRGTFCDIYNTSTPTSHGGLCAFATWIKSVDSFQYFTSLDTDKFNTTFTDLGNGYTVINFTNNNHDMDFDSLNSGWDTARFLSSRYTYMSVVYGINSQYGADVDIESDVYNYSGTFQVFLDYVTYAPTLAPSIAPSNAPSVAPSLAPSLAPSVAPSLAPSLNPSLNPSLAPSLYPSLNPSITPTQPPSMVPSLYPSNAPSIIPSTAPSYSPSSAPTDTPIPLFCQWFCFDMDDDEFDINVSIVEQGYYETIVSVYTCGDGTLIDDVYCDIISSNSTNQTSPSLDPSDDDTDVGFACAHCCIGMLGFTEIDRWTLLQSVNDDVYQFADDLSEVYDEELQSINYAYAQHVPVDSYCDNIPYPRICRLNLPLSNSPESDFSYSLGLDKLSRELTYQMCYGDSTQYFGVGWGSNAMEGDTAIWTTGKTDTDNLTIYDYNLTGQGSAFVTLDTQQDFTNIMESTLDGVFCVEFDRDFDTNDDMDQSFNGNETSIDLFYAVGTDTELVQHSDGHANQILNDCNAQFVPSPDDSDVYWCTTPSTCIINDIDEPDVTTDCEEDELSAEYSDDKFDKIKFTILCKLQKIRVEIEYTDYSDNWFGFVFNNVMNGAAIVWTIGKEGGTDYPRPVDLYSYEITAKMLADINWVEGKDWTEVTDSRRRMKMRVLNRKILQNTLEIEYEQDLSETQYDPDTKEITFRYAYGDSLILTKHTGKSDIIVLDLEKGTATVEEPDETIQCVHGILMFIAWSILASWGIISSSSRFIYNKYSKGTWFKIHRIVQIIAIVLDLVAFAMAIYFTNDNGNPHFDTPHKICGLVVTIIGISQPFNALIRPHPPKAGEKKATNRLIWEVIHKLFGYCGWMLAQVTIYFGIQALYTTEDFYHYIHYAVAALAIAIYFILWISSCYCCKDYANNNNNNKGDDLDHVDNASVELGAQFSTSADFTKQTSGPAFVDEDDAPIARAITGH